MTPCQVLTSGVHKNLGSRAALAGIDLAIEGGVVSVLGANGSGKTTLLRCLATVLRPDAGEILIDGMNPRCESDRIEIRRRLGYLPQEPGLAAGARVFDVLDYLAVLKEHRDDRRRRGLVFDALEAVGLADRANDRVQDLSGGMRRRLGLANSLLGAPGLLVLDEPAAGLDPDERQRLRQTLAERRHRTTIVVSTHLTDEAAGSELVIVLALGQVAFSGTPAGLAAVAANRAWVQAAPDPAAPWSWQLPDGTYRCLGTPPPAAHLVTPTLEDGYLLVTAGP